MATSLIFQNGRSVVKFSEKLFIYFISVYSSICAVKIKKMKRNTLFLLSYSIIIPLISSAPSVIKEPENLTSITLEQFNYKCDKYSKENFTKVQDYVKNCKDTNAQIVHQVDLSSYLCFGVVNNILAACDKSNVDLLRNVNVTYSNTSKVASSNDCLDVCALEALETQDYLKRSEKFFNLTVLLKSEISCQTECCSHNQQHYMHCLLWHETNKLLSKSKAATVLAEKTKSPPASDTTSQNNSVASENKTENKHRVENSSTNVGNNDSKSAGPNVTPSLKISGSESADTNPQPPSKPKEVHNEEDPGKKLKNFQPNDAEEKPVKKFEDNHPIENKPPKSESVPKSNVQENSEINNQKVNQNNNDIESAGSQLENPGYQPQKNEMPDSETTTDENFNMDSGLGEVNGAGALANPNINNENNNPVIGDDGEDDDSPRDQLDEETPGKQKSTDAESEPRKSASSGYGLSYSDNIAEEDSHFYVYFFTSASIVIMGYVAFHNKNKILAYALEGRRNRNSRRRPNSASYRKLDCSLEEAITSNSSHASVTNVVY